MANKQAVPMRRREAPSGVERRFTSMGEVELRADGATDGSIGFKGHASVFDKPVWIGPPKWGFWETVHPGAFAKTIKEADIRMLLNHDPNYPLARSTIKEGPGSLRLSEDVIGLLTDADMLPTSYARDLELSLGVGVVNQMSISFLPTVGGEEWRTDETTGEDYRDLYEARLFDVSPVTFPAFDATDASLRSVGMNILFDALDLDAAHRAQLIGALRSGQIRPELTPALRAARTALDALVEQEPAQPATPAQPDYLAVRSEAVRSEMAHLKTLLEAV